MAILVLHNVRGGVHHSVLRRCAYVELQGCQISRKKSYA